MKRACYTILWLTALTLTSAFAQQYTTTAPPGAILIGGGGNTDATPLTKFNLNFPGGTPKELVAAIEKATGRPLNAIVNDEFANLRLPALKMTSVTVPELFQALVLGSKGSAIVGNNTYSTEYGFMTSSSAPPSNETIWHFYAYKGPPPAKVCRFYSLAPYLDRGLGVDDITTAIETGWKMLGETNTPTISFHKDTKLLIAVGEPSKLETIDAALKALGPPIGGETFMRPLQPGEWVPATTPPAPASAVKQPEKPAGK
ncbi:MAG: hypothetical protein ACLQU3_29560 [Limisphaerales bacterium]